MIETRNDGVGRTKAGRADVGAAAGMSQRFPPRKRFLAFFLFPFGSGRRGRLLRPKRPSPPRKATRRVK